MNLEARYRKSFLNSLQIASTPLSSTPVRSKLSIMSSFRPSKSALEYIQILRLTGRRQRGGVRSKNANKLQWSEVPRGDPTESDRINPGYEVNRRSSSVLDVRVHLVGSLTTWVKPSAEALPTRSTLKRSDSCSRSMLKSPTRAHAEQE